MYFCNYTCIQIDLIFLLYLLTIRSVYCLIFMLYASTIIRSHFKLSGQYGKNTPLCSANWNGKPRLFQDYMTNIKIKLRSFEKSFIFRPRWFNSPFFKYIYPVHKGSLDTYFKSVEHEDMADSGNNSRMQYEWLRLRSFSNFPQTAPQRPMRLAQAGFFYTGEEDQVQCFSCGVQYSGWRPGDHAVVIHQQISPECRYMHGRDENNIPIRHLDVESVDPVQAATAQPNHARNENVERSQYNGESPGSFLNSPQHISSNQINSPMTSNATGPNETSVNANSGAIYQQNLNDGKISSKFDSLGIFFGKPRYPAYAVLSVRLSTFQDWPSHMTQTPRELSTAGFLYVGYSDYVRCFFCGGGLRNWERDDDPWTEHARWFSKCEFLRQNKGDDFVLLVQATTQNEEMALGQRVHDATKSNEQHTGLQTANETPIPAFESVLEMGYSREFVQQAYSILAQHKAGTDISAEDILDQIFTLEDASLAAEQDVSQNQLRTASMAATEATAPAVNDGGSKRRQQNVAAETVTESVKNMTLTEDTQSLRKENETLKERWQCKICMELEACIAFLPCGHLCCCVECAPAMRKCPICRRYIKGTVKTYPS